MKPSAVHCARIPHLEFNVSYERVLPRSSGLLETILPQQGVPWQVILRHFQIDSRESRESGDGTACYVAVLWPTGKWNQGGPDHSWHPGIKACTISPNAA
jgi:hypothetical protein